MLAELFKRAKLSLSFAAILSLPGKRFVKDCACEENYLTVFRIVNQIFF
jgi:hypothetical protein